MFAVAVALTPAGVQAPVGALIVTVGALLYPDPPLLKLIAFTLRKVPAPVTPFEATAVVPPAGAALIVAVGRTVYPLPAPFTLMEETGKPRTAVAVAPVPPPPVKFTVGAVV